MHTGLVYMYLSMHVWVQETGCVGPRETGIVWLATRPRLAWPGRSGEDRIRAGLGFFTRLC